MPSACCCKHCTGAVTAVTSTAWLQGVTDSEAPKAPKPAAKAARLSAASARPPLSPAAQEALHLRNRACSRTLLLCDFDKTLTDYDAGNPPPCMHANTLRHPLILQRWRGPVACWTGLLMLVQQLL